MNDIIIGVIIFFVFLGGVLALVRCDLAITEHDLNVKKQNDQRIETCFPSIYVQEVNIEDIKYVVCRSEPKSKDFKLKEVSK